MSFAVTFHPASLNAEQYDHVVARLTTILGGPNPSGRMYHACYGQGDRLSVVEMWESMEQFEGFGAVLMPVLKELGIDPGKPDVQPLYSVVVP